MVLDRVTPTEGQLLDTGSIDPKNVTSKASEIERPQGSEGRNDISQILTFGSSDLPSSIDVLGFGHHFFYATFLYI